MAFNGLKLVVSCHNKKVEKRGEERNNILYHLLITIFAVIKIKEGLKLHLVFISCKLRVYNTSYYPMKSSEFG